MTAVPLPRAMLAEFLGTFVLVLSISLTLAGSGGDGASVPIAVGLAVLVMIYAVGDLCGAHFNPAVTVGFWAAGRFPGRRVAPYWLAHFAGAVVASQMAVTIAPSRSVDLPEGSVQLMGSPPSIAGLTPEATGQLLGITRPRGDGGTVSAFACEAVLTFVLMLVILRVSTGAKAVGVMAGVAVAGTVTMAALVGGPLSGASLNPARSFGPAAVAGLWDDLWIYFAAPPLGALMAVPVDRLLGPPTTLEVGGPPNV